MNVGVLFALLAPLGWSGATIIDKFILANKVKHTLAYTEVTGLVGLVIATIVALFLDWSTVTITDLRFPALAGVLMGLFVYAYLYVLSKEDASDVTGYNYLYPVIAVMLAFLVLGEVLPFIGYVGVVLTTSGVLLLTTRRIGDLRREVILGICASILILGCWSFIGRLAVISISEWHTAAVCGAVESLTLLGILTVPSVRASFTKELRNARLALMSETFNFSGFVLFFFAVNRLPVGIATSLSAIMPLYVLFAERIVDARGGHIVKQHLFSHKILPLSLITAGVMILAYLGIS